MAAKPAREIGPATTRKTKADSTPPPSSDCVTGKDESPMSQKPNSARTIAITIITAMTGGVIIVTPSSSSIGAGGVGGTDGGIRHGATILTTKIMGTTDQSTV